MMKPARLGCALFAWLLIALWFAPLQAVQAQSVSCSQATMTNVSFTSADLVNGTGLTTTANLTYKCTASSNGNKTVNVCFNIGDPYGNFANRQMKNGSNALSFQMYQDSAQTLPWGTVWAGASMPPATISITGNNTASGTIPLTAVIAAGQNVPPGTYTADYGSNGTLINYQSGSNCTTGSQQATTTTTFPFTVSATVIKSCKASAGAAANINLGTVPASATNISANNTISITCATGTPYYIGLLPSNSNTAGAGAMKSLISSNISTVAYQLYQPTGGAVWGNTATSTSAGNGVAGIGNGSAQSYTVNATAPSADFQPDTYTDTVTVNVNY